MSKRPPKKGSGGKAEPHAAVYAAPHAAAKTAAFSGGFHPAGQPSVGLPPSATRAQGPSQAEILEALQKGGAYFAAGRPTETEQIARLILQFVPAQPDALHLLGLVMLSKGNPAEAERLIDKAIAAAQPFPNLLVNRGNAKRAQQKFKAALDDYAQALALDPSYVDAYFEQAELFQQQDRGDDAIAELNLLISCHPAKLDAYLRAAALASEIGDFAAGLSYCLAALERFKPASIPLMVSLALTYERLSELDEAVLWAERVLASAPFNALALRVWAKARRRQAKDDNDVLADLRRRLESIDSEKMPAGDARIIYAELANICDLLNDIPAAFDYFTRQNQKTLDSVRQSRIDAKAYLADVDRMIETFTPTFVASWARLPDIKPDPRHRSGPVFIVGFPRSGTTLLDQILDAHPDIQVIEERPLVRALRSAAEALPGGYPAGLASLSQSALNGLRETYWEALKKVSADTQNKIVIDKMPLNLLQAGLIQRVFPEARFILALRHPADSVLSCFMQDFVPNGAMANFLTLEDAARLYDRSMTLWQTYAALFPLQICEVRYERIVTDLETEAGRVLDFLSLPWNEAVRDPAAHALTRATIRTPSYSQVTQPIYREAMERWRRYETYLTPVLPLLERHIHFFGYDS